MIPEYTELWRSEIGSGMWGVQKKDIDIMIIYCVNTNKILRGEHVYITRPNKKYKEPKRYGEYDVEEQSQELGHLVNKLIDGNVNAIWSVMSHFKEIPAIYLNIHNDLNTIVRSNLSKSSYKSIRGMAISQYLDNTKRANAVNMTVGKAYRGAWRVAEFGVRLLLDNKIIFKAHPHDYIPTEEEVMNKIKELDEAYESSTLPEKSNEDEFRDFLYHVRLGFMERE